MNCRSRKRVSRLSGSGIECAVTGAIPLDSGCRRLVSSQSQGATAEGCRWHSARLRLALPPFAGRFLLCGFINRNNDFLQERVTMRVTEHDMVAFDLAEHCRCRHLKTCEAEWEQEAATGLRAVDLCGHHVPQPTVALSNRFPDPRPGSPEWLPPAERAKSSTRFGTDMKQPSGKQGNQGSCHTDKHDSSDKPEILELAIFSNNPELANCLPPQQRIPFMTNQSFAFSSLLQSEDCLHHGQLPL